jgi:hypothetical protein
VAYPGDSRTFHGKFGCEESARYWEGMTGLDERFMDLANLAAEKIRQSPQCGVRRSMKSLSTELQTSLNLFLVVQTLQGHDIQSASFCSVSDINMQYFAVNAWARHILPPRGLQVVFDSTDQTSPT